MMQKKGQRGSKKDGGFSLIELLVVLVLVGIMTAVAIPQMISQRRLMRSIGITREITTQLRYTRQLAMSQRRAFTLQYDNVAKNMKVIGPIPVGKAALLDGAYPNNAGSAVLSTDALGQGGLNSSEILYGIPTLSYLPSGASVPPTGALGDGVSMTALASNKLNITFQPDGTVINSGGSTVDQAMFFFNSKAAQATASAISVIGASGRIKVWRYNKNGNTYAE